MPSAHHGSQIAERVDFIGLDPAARASLRALGPLIAREIGPALDAFYRKAQAHEATRHFFADDAVARHAHARQASHWTIISTAQFDEDYEQAVRRIGQTHARLGLSPRWYIGAYAQVANALVRSILRESQKPDTQLDDEALAEAVTGLMKAVFLDIDLGISIYLETLEHLRSKEEAARIEAEANQTAVVRALAEALARVAEGDLTARVDKEVSADYQRLKDDFNGALARLVAARREAEAGSRAKSDFLSNISHEIRTPLNGVIGVAGALAATDLSPQQHEMVDLIRLSAETVERLLSDVLDISKVEASAMSIETAPFRLAKVVEGAVELFRAKAAEKSISLDVRFVGCCPGDLMGDAVRVAQIVTNLVSNAVKFTAEGGVQVSVRCDGDLDPKRAVWVTIEVADSGIGFAPEIAEHLFDRFSQADSSITRRYGGTGLGLAISKGIAEAMGGTITASSTPGCGSRFIVRLPFAVRPSQAEQHAPEVEGFGPGDASATPDAIRVLLVEDHPVNRRVARLILEPLGVDIVEAENGYEALRFFRAQPFDVVLMDMQMPVMDGLAATSAMRRAEQELGRPRSRIIMLTANVTAEHRAMAFAAGADEHLAKPIQHQRLLVAVAGA